MGEGNWFARLTGFTETSCDDTRAKLRVADGMLTSSVNGASFATGELEIPSLAELRARVAAGGPRRGEPTTLRLVRGDVRELHRGPEARGSLFQVASQFNLLEMSSPGITPEDGVGRYERDRTQGPACAMATGAATIFRNCFVPVAGLPGQTASRQIDCLAELGAELDQDREPVWVMRNGYALASADGLRRVNERLSGASEDERDRLRSMLRVGFLRDAEVTEGEVRGRRVSQALCSAMPVAYTSHDVALWEPLARLVLEAAYEATACCAVLNAASTGSRVAWLTLLGGGAFGNELPWILDALARGLLTVGDAGLDVRVVSHREPQPELVAVV